MNVKRISVLILVMVQCAIASGAYSQTTKINFDTLLAMDYMAGTTIDPNYQLHDQLLSQGVSFSSTAGYVAVVNLGSDHATSGTNGISGSAIDGKVSYAAVDPIYIEFFMPGNSNVKAVTNRVSIFGDKIGGGQSITLSAFSITGILLGNSTVADTGGTLMSISAPGIHMVKFVGPSSGGGVALDDLEFDQLSTVPEPATLLGFGVPMLMVGLGKLRGLRK